MNTEEYIYPFCAIVGQEEMKTALLLNIINPKIGGVLIRGEKGTAKSTAVRGLAKVLPKRAQAEGCPFSCDPYDDSFWCQECRAKGAVSPAEGEMRVINLPVSATEDRVVGTLDITHALKTGEKKFEPGILAAANRNILYVDEVNLLDDHIVDLLLDAAAMGVNRVEREGVSYTHPASFILVGTMNPEEGELRPQLIDRFGLVTDVTGEADIELRSEVIRRRLEFEADPVGFGEKYRPQEEELGARITEAKKRLGQVKISDQMLRLAAGVCVKLKVEGHRADITLIKTAVTNAAFSGREQVTDEDVITASRLALPHRLRRQPFESGENSLEVVVEAIRDYAGI